METICPRIVVRQVWCHIFRRALISALDLHFELDLSLFGFICKLDASSKSAQRSTSPNRILCLGFPSTARQVSSIRSHTWLPVFSTWHVIRQQQEAVERKQIVIMKTRGMISFAGAPRVKYSLTL